MHALLLVFFTQHLKVYSPTYYAWYCGLCSFLCKQRVLKVYKQHKDLMNGPSIQYYMEYEAEEIDLSCYHEAKKIILAVSTFCEAIKWYVVNDFKPLQVWIIQ